MLGLFHEALRADWRERGPKQPQRALSIVRFYGETLKPECIGWPAIDALVLHLQKQGAGSATIRAYLSALKVLLSRAHRLGWIETIPPFPELRTLPLPEPRDLVLRAEWIDRLELELLHLPHYRDLVCLLRWTGCRLNEGRLVRWPQVQPESALIQFINTKGKKSRTIPLHRDAHAMLLRRLGCGATGSGEVFPDVNEVSFRKAYLKARDRVCDALSIEDQVRSKWVVHTLRHTRLTELASQGWSAAQLMAFAGHSSMAVSEKYIHSSAIRFPSFND